MTAFFKANQISSPIRELANTLTYQEFPNHFALKAIGNNSESKAWNKRQHHSFAIGRMMYVGPTAGERFYLRTLLMVVRGPKSFDDLKTVDNVVCETFQSACLRRGLLEDDGEWEICLRDASEIKTGSQLRHLFTTLLLFCTPAQPNLLWIQFRDKICDITFHSSDAETFHKTISSTSVYILLTIFFMILVILSLISLLCPNLSSTGLTLLAIA